MKKIDRRKSTEQYSILNYCKFNGNFSTISLISSIELINGRQIGAPPMHVKRTQKKTWQYRV